MLDHEIKTHMAHCGKICKFKLDDICPVVQKEREEVTGLIKLSDALQVVGYCSDRYQVETMRYHMKQLPRQ